MIMVLHFMVILTMMDHYFIPDNVFEDIWDNNIIANSDTYNGEAGYDVDYCYNYDLEDHALDYDGDGEIEYEEEAGVYQLEDWWSWYDWDFRVDADGDIHAIMSIVPQSLDYVHYMEGSAGFYYLTCDKEDIASPGDVNSENGWRWSYLMDGGDTWQWDIDGDGYAEIYSTTPNLSFADDDPDVVWAVISLAEVGDYIEGQEEPATSCANWDTYIPDPSDFTNWSLDLWVLKSMDGGSTWSNPVNVTETTGDFSDGTYNGPEEMYPHTPAVSTSDNVYFMYQMPNWGWNEIGDPTGPDHMNWVYVGFAGEDIEFDYDDEMEINDDAQNIPNNFELTQNYPNPFNPSTSINFTVPSLSDVNISVYDINGRLVNTLINNTLAAGTYDVVWNGNDMTGNSVSAGIYIYNLTSGETSITNKMILVK